MLIRLFCCYVVVELLGYLSGLLSKRQHQSQKYSQIYDEAQSAPSLFLQACMLHQSDQKLFLHQSFGYALLSLIIYLYISCQLNNIRSYRQYHPMNITKYDKLSASTSNLKMQTQKAIKAINEYEKNRYKKSDRAISALFKSKEYDNTNANKHDAAKQFAAREIVRIQLLPNAIITYKIKIKEQLEPKLVVKNYRGGQCHLFIGYDRLPKQFENSSNKVILKSELLIKLNKQKFVNSQWVFFTFKNSDSVSMFRFRVDELFQRKSRKLKSEESLEEIVTLDMQENWDRSPRNRGKSLRIKSISSEQLSSMKPEEKKRKLEIKKYLEEQKIAQAKIRKENAEILRIKQIQARDLGLKCKNMVEEYESLVQQQRSIGAEIVKQFSPLVVMIKFCKMSNYLCVKRLDDNERVFTIQYFVKKFKRKIFMTHLQKKALVPDIDERRKQQFVLNLTLETNFINRYDKKKAENLAIGTIKQSLAGIIINQAMNQASKYRRFIRVIQKRWRAKYQARTSMLMMYAEQQLRIILKDYPHLTEVQYNYRKKKAPQNLCVQYQKEEAIKMKEFHLAYESKITQIQEYKQINQQIKAHNAKALKKRQKQLLEVPKTPAVPQPRFFRDLLFLKAMIRGWLQVQLRKNRKIQKKNAEQLPSLLEQKRGSNKSLLIKKK